MQDDPPPENEPPTFAGAARRRGKRWRLADIFQHGWALIVAALLNHQLLQVKPGRPEAWPVLPDINGAGWAISALGGGG